MMAENIKGMSPEEMKQRLRDYADEMEKKGVILEVPLIREQKDEV